MLPCVLFSDREASADVYRYVCRTFLAPSDYEPSDRIVQPGPGVGLRVLEQLETCHPTSGTGLELLDPAKPNSIRVLPKGDYSVVGTEHGMSRRWLLLMDLSGKRVDLCFAQTGWGTIDWRGVTRFRPSTAQIEVALGHVPARLRYPELFAQAAQHQPR